MDMFYSKQDLLYFTNAIKYIKTNRLFVIFKIYEVTFNASIHSNSAIL